MTFDELVCPELVIETCRVPVAVDWPYLPYYANFLYELKHMTQYFVSKNGILV